MLPLHVFCGIDAGKITKYFLLKCNGLLLARVSRSCDRFSFFFCFSCVDDKTEISSQLMWNSGYRVMECTVTHAS